jgi:protease IV
MMRRALLMLVALAACTGRPRFVEDGDEKTKAPGPQDKKVIEIDLSSGAPEGSTGGFIQLPATRTYTGLVRTLERALNDDTAAGVFVKLGATDLGFARAAELGDLLARFGDEKKPVVCHSHDYGNAMSWLVLRGCNRIWLSAAGGMDTVGIAAELVHLKGLLDRLKVHADILHIGRYKSGAEPLTREDPSPDTRESLGATLASMRQSWLDGAEQGRPGKGLREKLEQGPYSPEQARAAGLVDAVGFESDARNDARKLAKTTFVESGFGPKAKEDGGFDIGELIQLLTGGDDGASGRPRLAVVPAEGAIGMDSGGPLDSGGITAKALNRTLRRLRQDDTVKAVVLRIDSPGGSPLASDLIWHEMMELRKKKPVIASVGSMAASGGYYIACAAQKVVAERASIVGSIGVFGGKIVIGPALSEVGINTFVVSANPAPGAAERAAYLSPFAPWDPPTRSRVEDHMRSIYDLFIARVAEARKMPNEAVRAHAEGRIWSGVQGKERGLVDELGGLSKALDLARNLAGLSRDTPVSVEGQQESLLEMLLIGEGASEADVRAALHRLERERALLSTLPAELRVYADTVSSLATGERVVAALPLALTLR